MVPQTAVEQLQQKRMPSQHGTGVVFDLICVNFLTDHHLQNSMKDTTEGVSMERMQKDDKREKGTFLL